MTLAHPHALAKSIKHQPLPRCLDDAEDFILVTLVIPVGGDALDDALIHPGPAGPKWESCNVFHVHPYGSEAHLGPELAYSCGTGDHAH